MNDQQTKIDVANEMVESQIARLENHIEKVAARFESMAEDIRREKNKVRNTRVYQGPVSAVQGVLHTINWGVANVDAAQLAFILGDLTEMQNMARSAEEKNRGA